ncbi:PH domain-containing protein [Gaeumannomyces tritici R3-111a-1]|uniref:PH domain-containing protein n=1 Tax=Gaeumannomyces tritici (strain R3-111a-1) TaxID=644352 RepID=J3NHW3_GAET3|nr:PH domain-containing protein [Gaeumannomyces tritici R3-111a-1]EJT80856.1 PH domain-containing protein [Gaeumannomyces tritici R3-111a-1]
MAAPTSPVSRQPTALSDANDEAVPETDPSGTATLLAERLQSWKHAVGYLEEFMTAVEKVHKAQAREYEKILKTIHKPLKEGHHFDQSLGGVAGFFENMRVNTEAMVNSNIETEHSIKGTVLPILERLHKEIKHKSKELSQGAQKSAKEVEKARNITQKHIELLGQQTAGFESTGGKLDPAHDPFVIHRGVMHRLNKQVMEENNHRNDLIAVQNNFLAFETHVVQVMQQAMEVFNQFAGGQAEKMGALYADMLGACQRIPPEFEWKGFVARNQDRLVNPNDDPRSVDSVTFANQDHSSTQPLIEGSLERKSRNKLSWGHQTGYYVVTPSKFLHEFKESDFLRKDPVPELSIYLPDAVIGTPNGDKFNIKGKDQAKGFSSRLVGNAELSFKAHSAADAEKWFEVIKNVAGATGVKRVNTEVGAAASPSAQVDGTSGATPQLAPLATDQKAQEAGVTRTEPVTSPSVISPSSAKDTSNSTSPETAVSPTTPATASAGAEKPLVTDQAKPAKA